MKNPKHSYYASATGRCGDVEQSQIHIPCGRDDYDIHPVRTISAGHHTNPTTTGVLAEVRTVVEPTVDYCRLLTELDAGEYWQRDNFPHNTLGGIKCTEC